MARISFIVTLLGFDRLDYRFDGLRIVSFWLSGRRFGAVNCSSTSGGHFRFRIGRAMKKTTAPITSHERAVSPAP